MKNYIRLFLSGLITGFSFFSSLPAFASPNLPDSEAPENSEAIYIVFPDYPINVDKFYGNFDNVGHAGVLLISSSGLTKYYEFGRYSPGGQMRKITVSNVKIDENGKATSDSLKKVLSQLSSKAGQKGKIRGAYFLNMDFHKMKNNANGANQDYELISFNCSHFAERVVLAGNPKVDQPTIVLSLIHISEPTRPY